MQPILSGKEMQMCDKHTMEHHGMPSLVLMERAASAVCDEICSHHGNMRRVQIFCGPGNNGGDGVAVGRMLHLLGFEVDVVLLGNPEKYSEQLKSEIAIAESYRVPMSDGGVKLLDASADLYIDAMFGVGLTRGLSGVYEEVARRLYVSEKPVFAIDIPSGYDATNGNLLGEVGVSCDKTITFAYPKKGLYVSDAKTAAGEIVVADVGIYLEDEKDATAYLLDEEIVSLLPKRPATANKGTCGKVLVIAGSEDIYGACYLSAKAAYVSGSGLVSIYTHENNRGSIQRALPEAMMTCYESVDEDVLGEKISWADTVLVGPGLGRGESAHKIMQTVLTYARVPLVIDADGLNVVAEDRSLFDEAAKRTKIVITPHVKEMERLSQVATSDIEKNMEHVATEFARDHHVTVVLKNHTTIIAGAKTYFCASGNEALATAGSGDVLAGIIASLLGQGGETDLAAAAGAYLHGVAGVLASKEKGIQGVLASDVIDCLVRR